MSILEDLGINKEEFKNIEAQEVKLSSVLDSNVYTMKVVECGVFLTDNNAKMVKVEMQTENGEKLTQYHCIGKKDGSANEIGLREFKALMYATNSGDDVAVKKGTFKAYAKDVDGTLIIGMIDSKLKVCVRKVYDENNERYPESNEVEAYLDVNGCNEKGDNQSDTFIEKISKNPILIRKSKAKKEPMNQQEVSKDLSNW